MQRQQATTNPEPMLRTESCLQAPVLQGQNPEIPNAISNQRPANMTACFCCPNLSAAFQPFDPTQRLPHRRSVARVGGAAGIGWARSAAVSRTL